VGDAALFMPENITVHVLIFNQKPIGIELPNFVELEVAETDPGLKGDTVSGGSKPAKLSTGGVINVPLFINEGDVLKIDTRDGSYIERVRTSK
jgi:elongation factor P